MTFADGVNDSFSSVTPSLSNATKEGFRITKTQNGTGQGYFTYSWVANARM